MRKLHVCLWDGGSVMKKTLGTTPAVAPLPVLIGANYDEHGTPNAMDVAWGGQCGYHHVALNLSLNHKTTENLKHTKAFTLSIATIDTLVLPDYFGVVSEYKENKIEKSGIQVSRSRFVNAPIIENHPLILECKATEMQEASGEMHVAGEVVNMLADDTVLDGQGKVDLDKLQPISYDSTSHSYRMLGKIASEAFKNGTKIK